MGQRLVRTVVLGTGSTYLTPRKRSIVLPLAPSLMHGSLTLSRMRHFLHPLHTDTKYLIKFQTLYLVPGCTGSRTVRPRLVGTWSPPALGIGVKLLSNPQASLLLSPLVPAISVERSLSIFLPFNCPNYNSVGLPWVVRPRMGVQNHALSIVI